MSFGALQSASKTDDFIQDELYRHFYTHKHTEGWVSERKCGLWEREMFLNGLLELLCVPLVACYTNLMDVIQRNVLRNAQNISDWDTTSSTE